MKQNKIELAVAKLHLEEGDSLIVDARVFDVKELLRGLRHAKVPKNTRIFPVVTNIGETVRDSFLVMHAEELTKLSKEKIKELHDAAS